MRFFYIFILLIGLPSMASSELLFDGIASYIYRDLIKIHGSELQYKNMKYSDYHVTYQYQFWRIKDKSVCANYKGNLLDYSKCTVEAKKLFTDTCAFLQNSQENDNMRRQLKNMYCAVHL